MKALGLLLIAAAAAVGAWMISALWLMLAVGDIHRNWYPSVPLMGYHAALPIAFTLSAFIGGAAGIGAATASRK